MSILYTITNSLIIITITITITIAKSKISGFFGPISFICGQTEWKT